MAILKGKINGRSLGTFQQTPHFFGFGGTPRQKSNLGRMGDQEPRRTDCQTVNWRV